MFKTNIMVKGVINFVRKAVNRVFYPFSMYCARKSAGNSVLGRVYYFLFSGAFKREQFVFLEGRKMYLDSGETQEGTLPVLRRNIHRLEKGILMVPRRIPFGLTYLEETVEAFELIFIRKNINVEKNEIEWATDVLCEYFDITGNHVEVAFFRDRFYKVINDYHLSASSSPKVPYKRDIAELPSVNYADLRSLVIRRRSVRWFLDKKVERRKIDKAIEVGAFGPSACNRQPFHFRIFDDDKIVKKIVEIPMGMKGYGHNVPVLIVVVGQQRHFVDERDRHLIYIDSSLAVMGVVLALETLGLGSCCVNWPDIEEKERKMIDEIELASDERPIMLIAVGYPDPEGMVAYSSKKSPNQLRSYNFE